MMQEDLDDHVDGTNSRLQVGISNNLFHALSLDLK
jgi:hypothetical protein